MGESLYEAKSVFHGRENGRRGWRREIDESQLHIHKGLQVWVSSSVFPYVNGIPQPLGQVGPVSPWARVDGLGEVELYRGSRQLRP